MTQHHDTDSTPPVARQNISTHVPTARYTSSSYTPHYVPLDRTVREEVRSRIPTRTIERSSSDDGGADRRTRATTDRASTPDDADQRRATLHRRVRASLVRLLARRTHATSDGRRHSTKGQRWNGACRLVDDRDRARGSVTRERRGRTRGVERSVGGRVTCVADDGGGAGRDVVVVGRHVGGARGRDVDGDGDGTERKRRRRGRDGATRRRSRDDAAEEDEG